VAERHKANLIGPIIFVLISFRTEFMKLYMFGKEERIKYLNYLLASHSFLNMCSDIALRNAYLLSRELSCISIRIF
jgi:hypothetical protein